MSNKTFTDMMDKLMDIPEVEEHINSLPVQLGLKVLKQRMELNLTQSQVIKLAKYKGIQLTQAQLSRIENGDTNTSIDVYKRALNVLGGSMKVEVEFDHPPTERELQNI